MKDCWEEEDNKNKQEGTAIFFDGVFYGKVPQKLLRDPKVKLQAKALYAILHSYCQPKELERSPRTYVSQEKLAIDAGLTATQLRHWVHVLKEAGWLTIVRKDKRFNNNYVLHARIRMRK